MRLRTRKIAGCAGLVTLFACGDRNANKLKSRKTMVDVMLLANTLERYSVDYRITSSGADGVFENRPRLATRAGARPKSEPGMGASADIGTDLVYENGLFIRWWSGLPAATAPGSQGLFVQMPPVK